MNIYFLVAAGLTAATLFIHCYFGGKKIVPPLLNSPDIQPVPKYIHYGNWHVATIHFTGMTLSYVWAAIYPEAIELAVLGTLVSAAIFMWAVILNIWKKQSFRAIPHWSFFLSITIAGSMGLAG